MSAPDAQPHATDPYDASQSPEPAAWLVLGLPLITTAVALVPLLWIQILGAQLSARGVVEHHLGLPILAPICLGMLALLLQLISSAVLESLHLRRHQARLARARVPGGPVEPLVWGWLVFTLLATGVVAKPVWPGGDFDQLRALGQSAISVKVQGAPGPVEMTALEAACLARSGVVTPAELSAAALSASGKAQARPLEVTAATRQSAAPLQRAYGMIGANLSCARRWITLGGQPLLIAGDSPLVSASEARDELQAMGPGAAAN